MLLQKRHIMIVLRERVCTAISRETISSFALSLWAQTARNLLLEELWTTNVLSSVVHTVGFHLQQNCKNCSSPNPFSGARVQEQNKAQKVKKGTK